MKNLYEKIFNRSTNFFSQKMQNLYLLNIIYRINFFPIPTDVFLVPYVLAKKNT